MQRLHGFKQRLQLAPLDYFSIISTRSFPRYSLARGWRSTCSTMPRITAELLAQTSSGLNPCKERELNLRGPSVSLPSLGPLQRRPRLQNTRHRKSWYNARTSPPLPATKPVLHRSLGSTRCYRFHGQLHRHSRQLSATKTPPNTADGQ